MDWKIPGHSSLRAWIEICHEKPDPWPSYRVENVGAESSSAQIVFPATGVSTLAAGHDSTIPTYGSRGPDAPRNVESEAREKFVDASPSGELAALRKELAALRHQMLGREINLAETHGQSARTRVEETVQDIQLPKNVPTDLQDCPGVRSRPKPSACPSGSFQPVRKTIFKLMQIENDNQDLSFVEKVILSRDEISRLCNSILPGSAKSSEGETTIDFENLNAKSRKVVGFFGSKDVMRETFQKTKFKEQREIWSQVQNDTLAPGLYAWLQDSSLVLFYWHPGHSLPVATRKDMSCNFIRYIVDLCDTVCVCLESQNLNNSLFESVPTFSKRQRTQRLQISLVKASEDSVKVIEGFLLEGLPFASGGNALRANGSRREDLPLISSSGHDYKLSEGLSRVALLVSSTVPQKLSCATVREEMDVNDFPAYIKRWTIDHDYSLDLTNLSDADFVEFIRSAKLKQAKDYDELVKCNSRKKKEEKNRTYSVDQLVVKEEEHLSRVIESFIDTFLKMKYSWLEDLIRVFNSSARLPSVTVEDIDPTTEPGLFHSDTSTNLSSSLNQIKSELNPSPDPSNKEEAGVEVTLEARLSQLETDIYRLLLDENSSQRFIFPSVTVYLLLPSSERFVHKGEERFVFTIEGRTAGIPDKFSPIFYDTKVTLRSINDLSRAVGTGKVHRDTGNIQHRRNSRNYQGPLLSNENVVFIEERLLRPNVIRKFTIEPVCRTGDLSECLNQQAVAIGSSVPCGWEHAVLLTTIFEKLAECWCEEALTAELARQALASENPLDIVQTILSQPQLEFARGKWEELRDLKAQTSAEMHKTGFGVDLCIDMYKDFRSKFQSRISSQLKRFTTSMLNPKVRKQISESYSTLEAKLKEEEAAFLASQKEVLSRRKENTDRPLTLTFEACKLIERAGRCDNGGQKRISISLRRQELEKESITWHGVELAPMKEDLDRLNIDNEHAFSPTYSARKGIIDLDPSIQTLLKVIFLKTGQLLVFIIENHSDTVRKLLIYLCHKLGVKLVDANCIRRIKRGFDLVAFDENSRFIALYDGSISTIKTYRFDETFRHMDWTGVDISLAEYSIGRLIWMDFITGKKEIVFIDDLHRVRLCEVNQPGMVRSGNVHIGNAPIVKACVSTHGSCLLVLRKVKSAGQGNTVGGSLQPEADCEVELQSDLQALSQSDQEVESQSDHKVDLYSVHPAADLTDTQSNEVPESMDLEAGQGLTLDVYKLDDAIEHFSSIPLGMKMNDRSKLEVGVVSFSSQMHLVIFDSEVPSMLSSTVIKISSASEVCQLQQVALPEEEAATERNPGLTQSGPVLDYIYQIFEKYATSPSLSAQSRDLHLRMVLKGGVGWTYSNSSLGDNCLNYVKSSLEKLKRDKGKDFSSLNFHISAHDVDRVRSCIDLPWTADGGPRAAPSSDAKEVQMGAWIRGLVCLVPIQIARAEHNALKPMIDGLQLSGNVDYVDAISLANVIRFGLYKAVFDSWKGPVKVISSMGKQSSGKSYLLNHLSGSLLDVAGGRCTDGVWMTLRQGAGCLYVLLDFEGLGSFERSEQEDMLLSMLNAAISNLTIFNKKDFHLDKETEAIFERFQSGVSLVKTDAKLFRGLFYMAIKDVDTSDVEDLKKEFFSKISQICSKSQDNFLTRMYGGSAEISAMPSFNRPEFHESISNIARTVEELQASFMSGRSFLQDLKLIIAQIATKDWSTIDSKRVALRVNLLRKHLRSAISIGCFFSDGVSKPLTQFDDHVDILDEPLVIDEMDFLICDTALELTATGDILLGLMTTFKSIVARKGEKDEEWHLFFEKFIGALVLRRKRRVLQWIAVNTSDFSNDGDIQKLRLEAVALLAEVQQNLLLCSCKCERCFLRCIQEKGHPSNHSCMGDHRCVAMCTYCLEEDGNLGAGPCNDAAGHDGPHDCQEKRHTCGKGCVYSMISSNCSGSCSKKAGHPGDCQCKSRQHTCNQVCSLPCCKNPCVSPIDLGRHEIHACHEKFCPVRCTMEGCNRTCAAEDHFHGIEPAVKHHFCGSEHPCSAKCERKGNCEVLTEVSKKTQTFIGLRATFDYVLVSEQNGNRKGCCIVIPPFKDRHEGPHSHTSKADVVHFCETRCPACGYFCSRPMEHGGLHATTHGNMRDVHFVAESEQIDILDRK